MTGPLTRMGRALHVLPRPGDWDITPPLVKVAYVLVRVLAVAVIGGGIWLGSNALVTHLDTCARGGVTDVMKEGPSGECVGITDGSAPFLFGTPQERTALRAVERGIAQQDATARGAKQYVTVVYSLPAPGAGSDEPAQTFLSQLQGAYAAQKADNPPSPDVPRDGNANVAIQVLIASTGVKADQYRWVDQRIEGDVASAHVRAVAGIGLSLDSTVAQVHELTKAGIPVVGSTVTSDLFDRIKGFIRVAPSNQQEVDAVLAYNKTKMKNAPWTEANSVLLWDENNDPYSSTLRSEFLRKVGRGVKDYPYTVSTAQTVMAEAANDVCAEGRRTVLFAGRGQDLSTLIEELDHSNCNDPVTIVTGDDVVNMAVTPGVKDALRSGIVSVYYSALSYPDELRESQIPSIHVSGDTPGQDQGKGQLSNAERGFDHFSADYGAALHQPVSGDSNAEMAYDATRTAIAAIRNTENLNLKVSSPAAPGQTPTLQAVQDQLPELNGLRAVYGASGPIAFGTASSNPVGKLIPVLVVDATHNAGRGSTAVNGPLFKDVVQAPGSPAPAHP